MAAHTSLSVLEYLVDLRRLDHQRGDGENAGCPAG
jgi:hypothetical protein